MIGPLREGFVQLYANDQAHGTKIAPEGSTTGTPVKEKWEIVSPHFGPLWNEESQSSLIEFNEFQIAAAGCERTSNLQAATKLDGEIAFLPLNIGAVPLSGTLPEGWENVCGTLNKIIHARPFWLEHINTTLVFYETRANLMKKMFCSSPPAFLLKLSCPTEQLHLLFLQNSSIGAAIATVTVFRWAQWTQQNQNQMCSLRTAAVHLTTITVVSLICLQFFSMSVIHTFLFTL